jgi:O-antigen/teichoic acid export membrane protein
MTEPITREPGAAASGVDQPSGADPSGVDQPSGVDPSGVDQPGAANGTTSKQIRGSSLMMVGRFISIGINFASQVLVIRYLSKADYGAFAYALSVATLVQSLVSLGLDRVDTRFMAIYDERKDYPRLFGLLLLEISTILSLGAVAFGLVVGLRGVLAGHVLPDRLTVTLLVILILMAPLQALDNMVMNVFAVFARPKAVFVRRYIVEPGLRFAVIVTLITAGLRVRFLAGGWVVAGLLGLVVYAAILIRLLRTTGLLARFDRRTLIVPVREALAFSLPLLTTNFVYVFTTSLGAIVVGSFDGSAAVASFRAVQPAAALNGLVMTSFAVLFTPVASRLFARSDKAGLRDLYWQTSAWMAVLSFPLLLVTTALAVPVTRIIFGVKYEGSATYLVLMSAGYYLTAAVGFNGTVLQIVGRLRYVVVTNIIAMLFALTAEIAFVAAWGALGAAIAVLAVYVVHNLFKQAGLGGDIGVGMFDRRYSFTYLTLAGAFAASMVVTWVFEPPFAVGAVVVAVISLIVFRANRHALRVEDTFPELLRVPGLSRVLR